MWLWWIIASAIILSFYDLSKKASVGNNSVFPVLLGSTLSGWLAVSAYLVWRGDLSAALTIATADIGRLLLKSCIVGASWTATYMALRTLDITSAAPIRATGPLWTLIGGILLFSEAPTLVQGAGMFFVLAGCLVFSITNKNPNGRFWRDKSIFLAFAGTLLGSCSALYDKHLLQGRGIAVETVLWWFLGGMALIYTLVLVLSRRFAGKGDVFKFQWRWTIPLVGVLLALSDACYFKALSDEESLVSVLSMIRRSSVVITFFAGGAVFREKNIRRKAVALVTILTGVLILCIGK